MGATVFNMPDQICEMVRYTEYITRISKSELYRKAISYFIENKLEVTDEVLYMPLAQKIVRNKFTLKCACHYWKNILKN